MPRGINLIIQEGKRVAYRRSWLHALGLCHGVMWEVHGTVLSTREGYALVQWDGIPSPSRVNLRNLTLEDMLMPDPQR